MLGAIVYLTYVLNGLVARAFDVGLSTVKR
jgi:hypothetical protein